MNRQLKILIADANSGFCAYLARELDGQPDMKVVGRAADGLDAVQQFKTHAPDVMIMDIVLPSLDGLGVLRSLNQMNLLKNTMILVMTSFVTEMMEMHIASLGAHYLFVKPVSITDLIELLRFQTGPGNVRCTCGQKTTVTEMLLDMGIPTHIKGFPYAREAIILTLSAEENNTGITKFIYPQVAKKYSTTASRVERAIRHAIDVAWVRGDIDTHYKLFRNSVSGERGKPTNSEFIATLAEKLALQENAFHSTGMIH